MNYNTYITLSGCTVYDSFSCEFTAKTVQNYAQSVSTK